MLFKIIGCLAILSASSILGIVLSRDCGRRPQQLRMLQNLFQMLENEINFLSSVLSEAFEKIGRSSVECEVAVFFRQAALNIRACGHMDTYSAWEKAVRENISKTALNKEDAELLVSFGKILGSTDLEGQIKNIRLTLNQLKMQEEKAEESRKKNEAMYRNLGILGGLALVIILI